MQREITKYPNPILSRTCDPVRIEHPQRKAKRMSKLYHFIEDPPNPRVTRDCQVTCLNSKTRHFLRFKTSVINDAGVETYYLRPFDLDKLHCILRRPKRRMFADATKQEKNILALFWPLFPGDFNTHRLTAKKRRRVNYWNRQSAVRWKDLI